MQPVTGRAQTTERIDVEDDEHDGQPDGERLRDVVKEVWLEKIPYVVMAMVAAGLAMAATPASAKASLETLSLGSRALVASYGLTFYLVKTVVPVGLSPLYAFVTSVSWVVVAGLAMAVMVVVAMRRQSPAVAAAGVVYVALILPTLGFFATGPQLVADCYSYLPCLGWALVPAARWRGPGRAHAWFGWRAQELSSCSSCSPCSRFGCGGTR